MTKTRRKPTKEELVKALFWAASEIRELGCTCPPEAKQHGDDCTGHSLALQYEAIARGEDAEDSESTRA